MEEQYIGLTACDECGSKFRVKRKHQHLVGQPVRCPKCNSIFTMGLVNLSPFETAAIEQESSSVTSEKDGEEDKGQSRRRTKAEIKQELIDSICENFRLLHPRLTEIFNAARSSEEAVRIWVVDALEKALGYSKSNIDTEIPTIGGRIDIALRQDNHVFMVIECKNIRAKLNKAVRDQSINYATTLSAEWAVVTNGAIWKLYQVIPQPGRDPHVIEIFDLSLLDEDGVSEADAENLYLLTSKAVFGGDLKRMSHLLACTSKKRILNACLSERVVKAFRLELSSVYKDEHDINVKLDDEEVTNALREAFSLIDL